MYKIVLEGYSKESMDAALANAMAKAAAYLSESKDINIQVLELTFMPGRGYKAVIELHIVPMGEADTLTLKSVDVMRHEAEKNEYKKRAKARAAHLKHMISDHFAHTMRDYLPDIPDYLVQDMNEIRLLNEEIERAFFKAAKDFEGGIYLKPLHNFRFGPEPE